MNKNEKKNSSVATTATKTKTKMGQEVHKKRA